MFSEWLNKEGYSKQLLLYFDITILPQSNFPCNP